jgi:FMN phosphatase YigB (HAD superfamily)
MKMKAVVFDAYGTLFDVYSIQVLAEAFYPGKGTDIAVKWRDKQIEYTRLITQSDPHNPTGSQYFRPFWELTRLALEYTLDRLKLDRESGQVEKLMQQYAHLAPFAENLGVLQKIRGSHHGHPLQWQRGYAGFSRQERGHGRCFGSRHLGGPDSPVQDGSRELRVGPTKNFSQ